MMKNCLKLILLTFMTLVLSDLKANTYYVSSTDGNDSYSAAQAQNPSTPWQSLAKASAFFSSLKPGDNLLFKRGDFFYGSLNASTSGNSSSRITIGAYGSGAKPIFSGFTNVQNWSNVGNGIWQTTVGSASTALNMITLNGASQAMGRYPNADAANGGYLNYESVGSNSITDNELPGSPNWTGADVVIRKVRWILDICKITSHSGTTLNYTNPPTPNTYPGLANFGYFIQNDPRTLDKLGEWYFNKSNKTLQMYFGSNSPSNYAINVSTIDNVLNLGGNSYLTVDNISVEGGNTAGISATNSGSVTIQYCDVNNSGTYGIWIQNIPNISLEGNLVKNALSTGISVNNTFVSPTSVRNNTVTNTALLAGMGMSGDNTYIGISLNGSNTLAEYNTVDGVGFNGIQFGGASVNIKNNFVTNFCQVKDDGGGIYNWESSTTLTNRSVTGNIVTNAIGASLGTNNPTLKDGGRGIYLDVASDNLIIADNSVANCVGGGLFYDNISNVTTTGNTIYNTQNALDLQRFYGGPLLRNNTFKNNIFFPLYSNQSSFFYWNGELFVPNVTDIQTDMRAIGTFDNNYYRNDVTSPFFFFYHEYQNGTFVQPPILNLDQWKPYINQDYNSKATPVIPTYKINSLLTANSVPNGTFQSGSSNVTFWSSNGNFTAGWDNTNKISGGSVVITPNSSSTQFTTMYAPIGTSVTAGNTYLLRVTTLGTTVNGTIKASLRQTNSPYNSISATQSQFFGNTAQVHEFLITPTASEANPSYLIEVLQSSGQTYIDNIEFYAVNASTIPVESQVRFEYNASTSSKTISLGANYIGVDNTAYPGTVTLAPYTSKILILDNSNPQAPPPATSNSSLTSIATAPAVSCFGGSTTATVAASGGTAPYTGTGSAQAGSGNASLKLTFNNSASTNFTSLYYSIGTVYSTKSYVLRFTTLGSSSNGVVKASLRQTASPYLPIISSQSSTFGTSRVDHQFIFNAPATTTDASFLIEISENSGTIYVDNIAFFEATSSGNLVSENLYSSGNFEAGISNLFTWSINGNHTASLDNSSRINGTSYFTVTDATGAKSTTGVVISQPLAALQASSTAPAILSGSSSTTVSVTANGGTAPYTGVGNFTVGAGNYTYTVTDARGCVSTTSITVAPPTVSLTSPQPITIPTVPTTSTSGGTLSLSAAASPVACFGGTTTATVSAAGGTAPYSGTGSFTGLSSGSGSLKLSFNTPTDNYTLNYWTIGTVYSSKSYVLRFSTLGTTSNGVVRASIRQTQSPYYSLTPTQTSTFGTSRVDHQFIFNGPITTTDASFLIEVAENSGTTYIDNIAFFEATPAGDLVGPNVYPAGDFESGISGLFTWSLNGNHTATWDNSAQINGTKYFTVTDATGLANTVGIVIQQPTTALQAYANAPALVNGSTTVTVSANGGTPPYAGTGKFVVGSGYFKYYVTDASGCTSFAYVLTDPAAGLNTAGLRSAASASASLAAPAAATTLTTTALKITCYPNPSTSLFNLVASGGSSEKIYITVMSYDGKILFKTVGASNQTYTFGGNFIPGMYTVQVQQASNVQTFKLIKGKF
ncbi:right-handed parallel beta-helix repeat-containing protein [Ferruginibacter paludis]|uniref:right-handed parallel beta-helix repeat-containing protein n=1 Tax=Ferruginibacter paludis TaxID=1310417 RepID=UPI0025B33698|nr:right-handed parallel beta-helix repeat-containing protein [Ferruginibacter paludis]MDN3657626.1 right-handed parallel beta-helix repeat-containing protein [Ferruginibacter paludis]